MFEYHGWVCLRSTAAVIDDEPDLPLAAVRSLLDRHLAGYGLVDLRPLNGEWFLHLGGMPNHRGTYGAALVSLLTELGSVAPGSYGLLYVWDNEQVSQGQPDHRNEFRVYRLARGLVTEHADSLLSPVIPVLEDAAS